VEIDYCPQCRGVWLDRGELEKILANIVIQYSDQERRGEHRDEAEDSDAKREDHDVRNNANERYRQNEQGGRKQEGFFSNLMELFGGD
jgi:Zn-finger nucleic acid-binding protein